MIPGQTSRSRALMVNGKRRVYVGTNVDDPRYFVYRLHDATGRILYIGRSCDVVARIKSHVKDVERKPWVTDVRRVSMVGPFKWLEAVDAEREEIETHTPVGNIAHTERDHRPAIAERVAARKRNPNPLATPTSSTA